MSGCDCLVYCYGWVLLGLGGCGWLCRWVGRCDWVREGVDACDWVFMGGSTFLEDIYGWM